MHRIIGLFLSIYYPTQYQACFIRHYLTSTRHSFIGFSHSFLAAGFAFSNLWENQRTMAMFHLDKIIFNKTIIGITCAHCGGDLKPMPKIHILGRWLKVLTINKIKPKRYQCTTCQKKCTVL